MTAEFYDLLFVLALSIYWSLFRRQDFYYSCIAYQRSYHDEFIIGHKKPSFLFIWWYCSLSLSLSLFLLLLLCFLFRMFSASYFLRLATTRGFCLSVNKTSALKNNFIKTEEVKKIQISES